MKKKEKKTPNPKSIIFRICKKIPNTFFMRQLLGSCVFQLQTSSNVAKPPSTQKLWKCNIRSTLQDKLAYDVYLVNLKTADKSLSVQVFRAKKKREKTTKRSLRYIYNSKSSNANQRQSKCVGGKKNQLIPKAKTSQSSRTCKLKTNEIAN